jgi:hypothetical protein
MKFTNEQKMKCAQREVAMRTNVYAKMSGIAPSHQREIDMMKEIADDYRRLVEKENPSLDFPRESK